jgi:hypothetical protein
MSSASLDFTRFARLNSCAEVDPELLGQLRERCALTLCGAFTDDRGDLFFLSAEVVEPCVDERERDGLLAERVDTDVELVTDWPVLAVVGVAV